jgi:hypothetical protein
MEKKFMDYCYIEAGLLKEGPIRLPKSWRNVSGLNLASASELKEKGWLPAVVTQPTFDKATHKRAARSVSIGTDDVTITWATEALNVSDKWKNWKREMSTSDNIDMSREMEDLIEGQHSGTVTNEKLQAKYDAKKVKRAAQPEKPPEPEL